MKHFFFFVTFSSMLFCQKTAIIVTGPESSGSTLITREISNKLGWVQCEPSMSPSKKNEGNICVNISQPTGHNTFWPLKKIRRAYKGYNLKFILTTRDQNISHVSKRRRWARNQHACLDHQEKSKEILSEILEKEDCFIWNYETMIYLSEAYSSALFKFLEFDCDNSRINFYDANKKYVKGQ